MPTLQPDQATFLMNVLLASLRNEHSVTRRVIEAIPASRQDYKPDDISKSAMELAWHIVNTERVFLTAVATGAFDFMPQSMPTEIESASDLSVWYEKMFTANATAVGELEGRELAREVDFRGMFRLPAVQYLQFLMSHSIHHRGQLSMYLRPMGAKVPAIYGESYDTAQARKG